MDIAENGELVPADDVVHAVKHKKRKKKRKHKMAMVETPSMIMGTGNGDGGGWGLGGGLIGGVLLGALLGRNGGLFGNNGEGAGAVALQGSIDTNSILQTLGDIKASVPLAEAQVQLALAGQSANINNSINSANIANMQGQSQLALAIASGISTTQSLTAAQTLELSRQIGEVGNQADRNLFQLTQAISKDGEKTRALIQSIDKQNDSRLITAQANEIIELRAEQNRAADRHGIEINMINNQNQNQLQFQQQAQVLNGLAAALMEVGQIARATNTNLIVGNTGATTTGAQTANPVNVKA